MVLEQAIERADPWASALESTIEQKSHGQILDRFRVVIAVAIFLAIGVIVTAQVFNSLPDSVSGPIANTTADIENATANAFLIAAIVPLVIVGMLMLRLMQ